MPDPDELLSFWLDEVGAKGWYIEDATIDARIRERFEPLWRRAREKGCMGWTVDARSALALLILLDQFPRNMFRASGEAYSTDWQARAQSKKAIHRGMDLRIEGPDRQFFYLPLMHSECLEDQERAVRLLKTRMPEAKDNLVHAKAHREVIRRFGRFPHRNSDLRRSSTGAETRFMDEGGYRGVVESLREAA